MSAPFSDRVGETFITTGSGAKTLLGVIDASFQTVASQFADGNIRPFWLHDPVTNAWEVALYTISSSGTVLTLATLLASSTGSAIVFGSGTKNAKHVVPAQFINGVAPMVTKTSQLLYGAF